MTAVDERTRRRLSTGHEVELPLELAFAMGGVVVPARRRRLEALLPDGLSALAIAPGVGCVALVAIQYHRVGGNDGDDASGDDSTGLEPYDEFAVIVPAVRGARTSLLAGQLASAEVGGYVHWLPVTTEASVALGRELWGYPKTRASITVTDGPRGIRAAVDADGAERARLEVARPRVRLGGGERDWHLWSYTTSEGDLIRTEATVRGDVAIGSPVGASVTLESTLQRELGAWTRPLARLYGSRVRARLHEGERVAVANEHA